MENRRVLNAEELLEKIFFFMNEMVDTKDFGSTILLLTELGRTLANSERASFWYWDRAKKEYWTLVALDSPRIVVPEGSGIVGASIAGNETILINDPYQDDRFNQEVDKETGYQTRSILCIPGHIRRSIKWMIRDIGILMTGMKSDLQWRLFFVAKHWSPRFCTVNRSLIS